MKKKSFNWRHRAAGVGIILIALIVIGVFGAFLWQKVFFREQIARFLPYDHTIGFVEFNFDPSRPDAATLHDLVSKNAYLKDIGWAGLIPLNDLFWKWYGGRGGVALISSSNGQSISPVLLLKVQDEENLRTWLKSMQINPNLEQLIEQDYYGQKLISLHSGPTLSGLLSDGYFAIAENQELLKAVAEAKAGHTVALAGHPDYGQVYSALPQQNLAFAYFNLAQTLETLSHTPAYLSRNLSNFQLYFPFLHLFKSYGIALYLDQDEQKQPVLIAKELILFGDKPISAPNLFQINYSFDGSLISILPSAQEWGGYQLASFGGANLLDQKNQLQTFLQNRNYIYDLLFSGALSQIRDTLFDSSTDLEKDFFPLFQDQYLLTINQKSPESRPVFSLITKSKNIAADQAKLAKLLTTVGTKMSLSLNAQKTKLTLPDGTTGNEIKAPEFTSSTETISLSNVQVQKVNLSPDFAIYLASSGDYLLASSDSSWLALALSKQPTASPNWNHTDLVKPTEFYQLNLPALGLTMLKPFNQLEIAKKFTDIGTLAVYRLSI